MKKFYVMAAFAAAFVGMTSCNNDDDVVNNSTPNQLQISSVGLENITSRAGITAEAFSNGESLGLYIYRGTSGYTAYNDDADGLSTENVQYTQGTTWSATQPIILSSVKGVVYANYPYDAANTDPAEIATTVLANQGTGQSDGTKDDTQTDYMWATPVTGISNALPTVDLTMNHALAMVSFKFVQTADATVTYPGEGKVSKIVLKNKTGKSAIMIGDATMNVADGVITGGEAATAGITLSPKASETLMDVTAAEKLPRLLLYPVAAVAADDAEVTVTVDGNDYTLGIPALAAGYAAGNNYQYTFTLKGTGLEVTSVEITKWVDVPQTGGDIQTPDNN